MKTEYQVYCDYVKAKQKANAIDIIANRIISISQNSVVEELEDLNRKWQGDTIDIVKSKGMEHQVPIQPATTYVVSGNICFLKI